ncbi:olfactory receptor 142-like [Protopterus annectens]|uniref:olfactory receptor 142-like n=1 Tax=Protopterus annectens TaxID=7888 RepID=UPI001CF96531|nr:olfactory receptor 142-like [Protopterus annectens]
MENNSAITVIKLAFEDVKTANQIYFTWSLMLYVFCVLINGFLILIVIFKKELHEPMHIFFGNLLFNGIVISTAFLPKLSADILSNTKFSSVYGCYIQAFCVHCFILNEVSLLAVMAYDRYLAVCNPLRYMSIMTNAAVFQFVAVTWLYSVFLNLIGFILCLRLPLCSSAINKPYCDYYSILKLSCVDYSVNNLYATAVSVLTAVVTLPIITYSYMMIILVCVQKSVGSRWKPLQTCSTHLLAILFYLIGVLFLAVHSRLSLKDVPQSVYTFLSTEFLIVPPFANPLIYGLGTRAIRTAIKKLASQSVKKLGYT